MKMITECYDQRGAAVQYAFVVGSLISGFGAAVIILTLSTFFIIVHKNWSIDGEDGSTHIDKNHYLHLVHSIVGFGVGICFSSLYYRETAG